VAVTRSKILSLEELAAVIAEHKTNSRRVVQCHGIFDLIHPGHIRHFGQAKQEGDVLVVTLTPDRYVNKGPGRPVFNELLRSETIAALACVDYVAVNDWPTAVETIHLLKPDVYVKGEEYEAPETDVTGMIFEEERAILEEGGRLHFTHDVTFSSSRLLNAHFDVFTPEASAFLDTFRQRYSADDVIELLTSFKALKVLVVGDAIVLGRHPPAADFDPEIVTASCRDDREMLAGEFGSGRQFVLNGAEFVERALQLGWQELAHDPVHRVERQATARQLDLTRRRDDVRLFAGVHHQRFAVDLQNRLQ
jgi:rfaE bifunctional protein nucleotidyltransferase chain/domain